MSDFTKALLVVVMAMLFSHWDTFDSAESMTLATRTPTRTWTKIPTRTQTKSPIPTTVVPTNTVVPTQSPTQTQAPRLTPTPEPTQTQVPTPTQVQKTQVLLFENIRLYSGQIVTSDVIDVSQYNHVPMFLAANLGTIVNSGIEVRCHFLPIGGNPSYRYDITYLLVSTKSTGHSMDYTNVVYDKIIGPSLICDAKGISAWGTLLSFYLYLVP